MYGYDAGNTGHNPNATGPVENVSIDWRDSVPTDAIDRKRRRNPESSTPPQSLGNSPVLADGNIYVGTWNGVAALDADTGQRIWSRGDDIIGTTQVAMDGTVYTGSTAIDADSGEKIWDSELSSFTLTLKDGILYVLENNKLSALNASNGKVMWNIDGGGWGGKSPPAVDESSVYVSSDMVMSLDSETGDRNWSFESDDTQFRYQTVLDGVLCVTGSDDAIRGIDTDTGERLWMFELNDTIRATPAMTEEMVYIGDSDPNTPIYALDKDTGEVVWSDDIGNVFPNSNPAVVDGAIYFVGGGLNALDSGTGEVLWRFDPVEVGFSGSPAVVDGTIYIRGRYDYIIALN